MNMPRRYSAHCLFVISFWLLAQGDMFAATKPNILIIVGDEMGYADVGFHGCQDIPTPNLDALAASGVRFTNAYVTGPYCSPTRAGLLTGRYQTRFGHETNFGGPGGGLPVTESTLADRLKSAGYNLAHDIHEDNDLSDEMPDKIKELQAKWDAWDESNIALGGVDGAKPGAARKQRKNQKNE
jgi:arylsulfatase A-like enzyme